MTVPNQIIKKQMKQPVFKVTNHYLNLEDIHLLTISSHELKLSVESAVQINKCRNYLEEKLKQSNTAFYGINTGFGSLCNVSISKQDLQTLQSNLVQSHAAGTGEEVPVEIVKLMLFLKIQSLSYGYSGIRLETIQRLIDFYNHDILPVIYQQGSLGASGDLAPLAHLSLPLIGLGEVYYQGKRQASASVLSQFNWKALRLEAKEGLALLNGTQFSTAYGLWALIKSEQLLQAANLCAAIALDAFDGLLSPFDARLHAIRPHEGQVRTAAIIRELLKGSLIAQQPKSYVQDPYSFRCVPQVHGASHDAITHVKSVFIKETNAVTDNPNIFYDDDAILSGGNFHAQALALPLDYLAIALAELGNISERRVFQLISGERGLPAFLAKQPGLNSGMMIAQYTAASIVSQNKQWCSPASVDSIVSSNGQEDHVSMAANAATKLYKVVNNVEQLLAIELMVAVQAIECRLPLRSSPLIVSIVDAYRKVVPSLEQDRVLSIDMKKSVHFLRSLNELGTENK